MKTVESRSMSGMSVEWGSPLNVVTDIKLLDHKPIEIQTYVPPIPNNIGLAMQYQETTQWCWIAVATSINHFYDRTSTWSQCKIMTQIGQTLTDIFRIPVRAQLVFGRRPHRKVGRLVALEDSVDVAARERIGTPINFHVFISRLV
jgi:hypothetical protein